MPDIMQDFEHLKAKSDTELFSRRRDLIGSSIDPKLLSDAALVELLAIARILRTRTVAPKVASSKKAIAPTLDAL